MLINSANLRALYTGFSAAFQGGFGGVAPQYGRIAQTVPSTTREQEYGWLGEMPRIREWIGDRVVQNIGNHGYTIKNRKFESTIGVASDDIEDDNLGLYSGLFEEFGRSAATFPDELVWPLLASGFAARCYDGQYFFDTDHPVLDENGVVQSVSNAGGGSGTAWYLMDVSRVIRPIIFQTRKPLSNLVRMDAATDETVFTSGKARYGIDGRCNVGFGFWQLAYGSKQTLNPTNYEAARVAMRSMKGDYGRPLGLNPRLLVVPPSLEGAALDIVRSVLVNGGESNKWAGSADVLVADWLA